MPSTTTTPFLHPRGPVQRSTIYRNEFPSASWTIVTYWELSPIWIAAMEKRLQFQHRHRHWKQHQHWPHQWQWHQHQHRHTLDYTSIRNWITGYDHHLHFACRAELKITMAKCLHFRYQHRHTFAYAHRSSTTGESATVHQVIGTWVWKENDHLPLHLPSGNQYCHGEASQFSILTA